MSIYKKAVKAGFVCFLFLLTVLSSRAQTYEERRYWSKTYQATDDAHVEIANKYGHVEVKTWAKDSVRIDVSLIVRGTSLEKVLKSKNSIDVLYFKGENFISVKTTFGTNQSKLITDISNLSSIITTVGTESSINYTVYVPASNTLKILNGFGNVYMGDYKGHFTLDLTHGDLRAGTFYGESVIRTSFGKAYIREIKDGTLTVDYCDLDLKRAEKLRLVSKSSTLEIGIIKNLIIDSKRDKCRIEFISTLKGSGNFSKFDIEKTGSSIDFNLSYGSLGIETLSKLFSIVNINSNYSDVKITLEAGASAKLNIVQTDVKLYIPGEISTVKTQVVDASKRQSISSGYLGSNASAPGRIQITASKGEIQIFPE